MYDYQFDSTDVAFFTIGVSKYMASASCTLAAPHILGGRVGFVEAVMSAMYAGFTIEAPDDGFSGVFAYDVMEPLGEACAEFVDRAAGQEYSYEEFFEEFFQSKLAELISIMQDEGN